MEDDDGTMVVIDSEGTGKRRPFDDASKNEDDVRGRRHH
jgi:hypothetical protein